ncbi:hypothetical protein MKX03_024461 [Papaver bracteatum]|nr:hypothetical protein MKX03_024461 [Papaver bracteatum]
MPGNEEGYVQRNYLLPSFALEENSMSKRPMLTGGGGYWNQGRGKALILGQLHLMTLTIPNGQPYKGTEEGYRVCLREREVLYRCGDPEQHMVCFRPYGYVVNISCTNWVWVGRAKFSD